MGYVRNEHGDDFSGDLFFLTHFRLVDSFDKDLKSFLNVKGIINKLEKLISYEFHDPIIEIPIPLTIIQNYSK